jgi:hypothetical protein
VGAGAVRETEILRAEMHPKNGPTSAIVRRKRRKLQAISLESGCLWWNSGSSNTLSALVVMKKGISIKTGFNFISFSGQTINSYCINVPLFLSS